MSEAWELADESELPERFTDPLCDDFRYVCSNGWEGTISIGSAFIHKPRSWPQCFPLGADGDACCTSVLLRRQPFATPDTTRQEPVSDVTGRPYHGDIDGDGGL